MGLWWVLLISALALALYKGGLLSVQIAAVSVGWSWGLFHWWRGRYTVLSGRLIRWFHPGKCTALRVFVAGEAGSVSLEITDRSGAVRYAWYGVAVLDTRVEIEGLGRFFVRLQGEGFRGDFMLSLET